MISKLLLICSIVSGVAGDIITPLAGSHLAVAVQAVITAIAGVLTTLPVGTAAVVHVRSTTAPAAKPVTIAAPKA